jgi:hypothetical protein
MRFESSTMATSNVRAFLAGRLTLACLVMILHGCGVAEAPLKDTPKVVATPRTGELSIMSKAGDPVGDVTPVYISVANGTGVNRTINPGQIFALDPNGDRIAPLPPGEAARQAGGAGALKAELVSAGLSGAGGAAVGAGLGAIAGAIANGSDIGGAASGAAIGGATGAGVGIFSGVGQGQGQAQYQADSQISALAIPAGDVRQDFTVSGYVFFPKGNYSDIVMLVTNAETGNTEVIKEPWH